MERNSFFECDKLPSMKTLFWCLISDFRKGGISYSHPIEVFTEAVFGLASYSWSFTAISLTIGYPINTRVVKSAWLWHASSFFLFIWMPLSYPLIRFRKRKKIFPIVFVTGCVVSIIFIFAAAINLIVYLKPGFIKNEYLKELKAHLKTKKHFPGWALGENCCGWDGPRDLGCKFSGKDNQFTKSLRLCFNNCTVKIKKNGNHIYVNFPRNFTRNGCSRILDLWVNENREVISSFAIFIIIAGCATIALYLYQYLRLLRRAPTQSRPRSTRSDISSKNTVYSLITSRPTTPTSGQEIDRDKVPRIYIISPSPPTNTSGIAVGDSRSPKGSPSATSQTISLKQATSTTVKLRISRSQESDTARGSPPGSPIVRPVLALPNPSTALRPRIFGSHSLRSSRSKTLYQSQLHRSLSRHK